MTTRRTFLFKLVPAIGLTATCSSQLFAAPAVLDPKDPMAAALGYTEDATKTDKAKYPKYAAGQDCANCQQYQGKASDASGPCTIFQGKLVKAKGWCSAYVKKA
jgi:hypothetical protein